MSELTFAEPQRVNTPKAAAKETVLSERRETNPLEPTTLQQWQLDTLTGTFAEPRIGYDFSRVAAFTGLERQNRPLLHTPIMVQQSPKSDAAGSAPCPYCPEADSTEVPGPTEPEAEAASPTESTEPMAEPPTPGTESVPTPAFGSEPVSEAVAPGETPASALIVEDSAEELGPGQMKKSDFLARLRAEVSRTVDAAIAETGRDTEGCPYLEHWFDFYQRQDSAHVERAIRRYAPETSRAATAGEYIPIITERARRSAEIWARTGEITGIPEGLPMGVPGMELLGSVGRLFSGIGSMFFKARDGGARRPDEPRAIQDELGEGQPLDSGVRSRMESAFRMDFAHVRAHTDATASGLSTRMNARAFTVGDHVAFGANEYKPGTLVGDALIAHELAHVVQQSGGNAHSSAQMKGCDTNYNLLEDDADKSSVGAVASLWGDTKGALAGIARDAMPRLRSGLRLQCCGGSKPVSQTPGTTVSASTCRPTLQNPQWDVSSRPRIGVVGNACAMELSGRGPTSGSSLGQNGMEFRGSAQVAPNCPGRLFFTQYVNQRNIDFVACVDNIVVCQHGSFSWGIDKFRRIPDLHGTNVATMAPQAAAIPLRFGDSPGHPDLNEPPTLVRFCMASEFVTYIVYEGENQAPAPLGWMHWRFNATAWRGNGTCPAPAPATGCSGWQVDGLGEKLGDSFGGGGSPPVPLDLTQPVVTAADVPLADCPDHTCPVPSTGGGGK